MKRVFLGLWMVMAVQAVEPRLPKWTAEEQKAFEAAGGLLGNVILMGDPLPEVPSLEVEQPTVEEMTPDPVRSSEIPERFLSAYFEEKSPEFLVDPQGLLGAKDFNDRLSFLKYHASDSSIDFYIYVFGGEQEIPGEVRAEETVERLYSTGAPAVVVFYYLGAPQRSMVYLSPSLTEGIPVVEQRRALQSSVMAAFEKLNHTDQLEAFSVQMSIRIYWMERMLGGGVHPEEPVVVARKPLVVKDPEPSVVEVWKDRVAGWFEQWWGMAALVSGSLMLGSAFFAWLRAGVRMRFPEFEVEPRLGGDHGAGVGAVISFASASLPPASQKDQVPDYLRRA